MNSSVDPTIDPSIFALMDLHNTCVKELHPTLKNFTWRTTRQRFLIRKIIVDVENAMLKYVPKAFEQDTFITYGRQTTTRINH